MDEQIKVIYGDKKEGIVEILNKLKTAQKILELLETKEVEIINITYKKRELAQCCDCTSSEN